MNLVDSRTFAIDVVRRLRHAGFTAYWAGGCVRDLLRGVAPKDYDVATDARPDAVRDLFGRKSTLAVGEAFGVVIVLGGRGTQQVEVATFRSEGPYRDGRRPESVEFSTPEQDALRRDFTINGMFYDPVGEEVLDFVGGRDDLHLHRIRAIGDPLERMSEDKLRLLRAIRFAASLEFELDERTARAVAAMAPEIAVVSVERIAQELKKMLADTHRRRAMSLCRELGLMDVILPELSSFDSSNDDTLAILDRLHEPSFPLAFAALLRLVPNPAEPRRKSLMPQGTLSAICRRLKLSNQESEDCLWLHAHQDEPLRAAEMTLAQLKRLLAHPLIDSLLDLTSAKASVLGLDPRGLAQVRERKENWARDRIDPAPLISGHDVLKAGARPGPQMKQLIEAIRELQLNEQISTRDEALERLAMLLREQAPRPGNE